MAVAFGSNSRSAGIRWAPPLDKFADAIKDLRDPVYDTVYNDLRPWVTKLRSEAQANAEWTDRTGKARAGLFAYRRRGKSFMLVALSHGPRTVSSHSAAWPNFKYGVALETWVYDDSALTDEERQFVAETHAEGRLGGSLKDFSGGGHSVDSSGHGTYAIIMPTMEANYAEIMASFKGALVRAIAGQIA